MQTKNRVIPFLLLASACSGGGPVDIGDDPKSVVRTGEKLSDYAATWTGYVEAFQFTSGSDRIRITLDETGSGTVELGDAEPPAPATDPDAFYPDPDMVLSTGVIPEPVEGFQYAVIGALVESKRLRLGVNPTELYRSWCELQTSYYFEETSEYSCLPGGYDEGGQRDGHCYLGDADDPETRLEVACAKLPLCTFSPVCDCSESGCTVENPSDYASCRMNLDAALEDAGETLDGTLTGVGRVRMTRD